MCRQARHTPGVPTGLPQTSHNGASSRLIRDRHRLQTPRVTCSRSEQTRHRSGRKVVNREEAIGRSIPYGSCLSKITEPPPSENPAASIA
ncbi:hypothetical protein SCFA_560016 [anaerobic digester metagenome]|uniref:Uncharacterized protein n=1 Tax=anaerobic digester metagenome TaxID=1263854 RepID=A0A485M5R1_9ZZZZ